ncbi:MAG: MerR family transcriptional regulator [Novosphingobium sp.]
MTDTGSSAETQQGQGLADGKDPQALRTIGEVAKALGIRQHVLRYWEEQFPMLRPLKRSGGRRYYRPQDIQLVETIDRLVHREGYTLKGAKKALQGHHHAVTASLPEAPQARLAAAEPPLSAISANFALRARLIALRTTLANALYEA